MQQKLAKPESVMPAYAESIGLPYLDLADIHLDPQLATRLPATLARQNSCAPLMVDGKQVLFVAPNPLDPDVEQELRLRMGLPVARSFARQRPSLRFWTSTIPVKLLRRKWPAG